MQGSKKNDGYPSALRRGAEVGLRLLGGVGRRLLVHLAALTVAAIVGLSALGQGFLLSAVLDALLVYVGFVCLVPRGEMSAPEWYFPGLAGVAQGVALLVWGLPLPLALFFAGLQTWVQRLIQSRGDLGWEWTVSPLLLLCLFFSVEQVSSWPSGMQSLWSFPVLGLLGWAARTGYLRLRADAIHKKMLHNAEAQLRTLAVQPALPDALRQQVELLLAQVTEYAALDVSTQKDAQAVVSRIAEVVRQLGAAAQSCADQAGAGPLLGGLLRSNTWRQVSGSRQETALEKALAAGKALNAQLGEILAAVRPVQPQQPEEGRADSAELARISAHEEAARQLLQSRTTLPPAIAAHVEIIASAAVGICQNMRNDPQDRPAGHKFLGRYLKVVQRVVDEHVRLAAKDADHADVAAALARSEEILARLGKAFQDERAGMLHNDAINYTAELNALEKLLTMRGH